MPRWISIVAGLLSVAVAGSAWAGDGTCKALERGRRGEHLRVALHVERGQVTGADVVYSPPQTEPPTGDARLQLDLRWMEARETDLGRANEVALSAMRANGGDVSDFAAGHAVLVADDGKTWEGASTRFGGLVRSNFALRLGARSILHPDLIDRLDQLQKVGVEVRGGDGAILAKAGYDLSDHAGRDALLHAAWARASGLAAGPEPCR